MVATSINDYLKRLGESRLIADDRLRDALRELTAQGNPQSADEIAGFLIEKRLLTEWQHEQLTANRRTQFYLGKYKLLGPLGSGGLAHVYLAEHAKMRRRVTLKFLSADVARNPQHVARFQQEALAIAAIDHPNIVRVYEIDNTDTTHYLVMEYVDGLDLQTLVERDGPADFTAAADWIRQAALALQYAHEAGMAHRDMRPSNLLLTKDRVVKLANLGVARLASADDLSVEHAEARPCATDYMAPESILDTSSLLPVIRTDLYGLGSTLFFLLTGRPPFAGDTLASVLLKHQTVDPRPELFERRPDMLPELAEICLQLMAKRPEDRLQPAAEVARRLQNWLQSGGATAVAVDDESDLESEPAPVIPLAADDDGSWADQRPVEEPVGSAVPVWAIGGAIVGALLLVVGAIAMNMRNGPAEPELSKPVASSRSFVDPSVKWVPDKEEQNGKAKSPPASRAKQPPPAEQEPAKTEVLRETELLGGPGGNAFRITDPQGRPMLGIEYSQGDHLSSRVLSRITPLYERPANPPEKSVLAGDGYAVAGMNVAHDHSIFAVQLIFVRFDGTRLIPEDRYTSDWIGERADKTITVLGDAGVPVLGNYGRRGAVVDAMGLLLGPAYLQLFVHDHFDDGQQGAVAGQATGYGFAESWQEAGYQDAPDVKIPAGRLGNRSLGRVPGLSLLLPVGKQQDGHSSLGQVTRRLQQPLGAAGSTLYVSFDIKPTGDIGAGPAEGYGGLSLGDNQFAVFVGYPGGDQNTPWGVSKHGSREEKFMGRTSARLRKHRVVKLVLRADFQSGADQLRLYVSPESATEPQQPDAELNQLDTGPITRVAWTWSGAFRVDDLRLGPTYDSVTAPLPQ